ncbi:hypothetical protein [Bradyrhizobium sp. USDA 10063]
MADLNALTRANTQRWNKAKLTRGPEFVPVAARLASPNAKERYEEISKATGVPWFVIAVIHQRESSQRWDRQLAQGDPLHQVSIHVPKGRGPFYNHADDPPLQDAFYRAALDALIDCPPYASRWKDWSPGGTMTLLEQYNGLGYANRGRPSPYIWSGTDQYKSGKYVRDGVYDPNVVDSQPGCAGLLMEMMALDPTITFTGLTIKPANSTTVANVASITSSTPATQAPSVAHPAKGSIGAFVANIFSTMFKRK